MKKVILPICLWLGLVILLVGGILISEAVIDSYDDIPFKGAMYEIFGKYDEYEEESSNELVSIDEDHKLLNAYKVTKNGKLYGYAYLAEMATASFNKEKMTILYGCEIASKKLLGLAILSADTNDYYYVDTYQASFEKLVEELTNANMDEGTFGNSLTVVSGATFSRNAIIDGAKLAREQFYLDIDATLPVSFTFVSFDQILTDATNICQFEYLFDNQGNQCKVVIKMDPATKAMEVVSDDSDLSADDQAACLAIAESNKPRTYISTATQNPDNTNNWDIRVITNGFAGNITIDMTVSPTAIVDFEIVSENESYDLEYNSGYQKVDPVTTAPTDAIDHQNNFGDWTVCTGATITQNAIKGAVTYAYKLIAILGGAE